MRKSQSFFRLNSRARRSPGSVDQRVPGLVLVRRRRTDVGDHDGPAVSAQRLAEQPREFAVPVVDEPRVRAPAQGVYAVAQCQQRPVDVSPFFEPFTAVLQKRSVGIVRIQGRGSLARQRGRGWAPGR